MKRLITTVLLLALLLCGCNLMDLYEYALTMENDNSFACTDGYIYKSSNRFTGTNDDGTISVAKSNQMTGWNSGAKTKKKHAEDMEPHEFIFAIQRVAFIRNDGSIWLGAENDMPRISPFSPHDESVPEDSPYELSMTVTKSQNGSTLQVALTNIGETTLPSPYVYLFVQLADGSWYEWDTLNKLEWISDTGADMEQGELRNYSLHLPHSGKKYITGRYRIAVYSNLANEATMLSSFDAYKTYFTDTAQLEAYAEFELSNASFNGFELSDFESTITDLTVK